MQSPYVKEEPFNHDKIELKKIWSTAQRERSFDTSDIAQLPRGRAIMTASGHPALLLALQHFSTKPYGDDVKASQEYYEPVIGETTHG